MKLQGRIPVEPLDDERLTNIERKLVVSVSDMQAPPERVSRRMLAFAGAAMAVALAGVAGWKLHRPPAAPIAQADQPFSMTSRADTAVAVTRSAGKTELALAHGNVALDVKHDPSRLLVIHAGDTDIEDVGTKFSVEFDGKNHVEVRVTEGEVKVARGGKEFAVTASNAWTTETGTITIAQLDAANVDVVASNAGSSSGTSGAEGSDSRGSDARDGRVGGGSDARGSGVNEAVRAGSGAGSAGGKHKAGVREAILAIKLTPDPGSMADYNEALKTKGDGEDKSRLLYSIAVKQHEAKNDSAALHSIEGIVNGRTKDAAYKDAMWLQVRVTCLQGLDDRCRVAAQRYLNNLPDGVQAGVAQAILKEIAL